jgi:hypothetical protein
MLRGEASVEASFNAGLRNTLVVGFLLSGGVDLHRLSSQLGFSISRKVFLMMTAIRCERAVN